MKSIEVRADVHGLSVPNKIRSAPKTFTNSINCAAENDLIVVTHAGLDIGFPGVVRCSPQMAKKVVETVGEFKFVLAHMGGWKNWSDVLEILGDTKIFIDTSFSTGKIIPRRDFHWEEDELNL